MGKRKMEEVKVTELRQNLPEYLAKVKRGQRVRVTSRGKVVAELAPPAASPEEVEAARSRLRGSVLKYDNPTEPAIDPAEWDVNK
jgi:prevent-host-death family protein